MKTRIQIHKEGKYFVAIDLITNVADQGITKGHGKPSPATARGARPCVGARLPAGDGSGA
jgi:hypothetical protein